MAVILPLVCRSGLVTILSSKRRVCGLSSHGTGSVQLWQNSQVLEIEVIKFPPFASVDSSLCDIGSRLGWT